jgi:hypothetical protein
MPLHETARDFWVDVYFLHTYSNVGERGKPVFAKLQRDYILEWRTRQLSSVTRDLSRYF